MRNLLSTVRPIVKKRSKRRVRRLVLGVLALSVASSTVWTNAPAASADTSLCYGTDYSCISSTGYGGPQSVWGSWGAGHNCVSYVAFRLRAAGAVQPWGGQIGNAIEWDEKARGSSPTYRVDSTPTVGSVAQWNTGSSGHIAMVDEVTSSYIVISEDAYLSDTSGYAARRRLDRSGSVFQTANFIHVKDAAYRRGDANGDGRVNAIDLSMVISHDDQRRSNNNDVTGDVNHDAYVGAADMAIVLGSWTW